MAAEEAATVRRAEITRTPPDFRTPFGQAANRPLRRHHLQSEQNTELYRGYLHEPGIVVSRPRGKSPQQCAFFTPTHGCCGTPIDSVMRASCGLHRGAARNQVAVVEATSAPYAVAKHRCFCSLGQSRNVLGRLLRHER
jgi:hypothetical protein